jgi:hypothetical protein
MRKEHPIRARLSKRRNRRLAHVLESPAAALMHWRFFLMGRNQLKEAADLLDNIDAAAVTQLTGDSTVQRGNCPGQSRGFGTSKKLSAGK